MASSSAVEDRRCRVMITEQQLLCKNQCGFYGTPQWNGLCSRCWHAHQREQQRIQQFNKNKSLLAQQNDRRLSVDPKKSLRAIIKKSPSMFSTSTSTSVDVPARPRSSSPDSMEADQGLHNYLVRNFSPAQAQELELECEKMMDKLQENEALSMDELSVDVLNFYTYIVDKACRMRPITSDFTSAGFLEQVESYIAIRGNRFLFCTRTDEEVVDLSLQERIRSLHWVTQGFLETALDFDSQLVEELLDDAMNEIVYMNSHRDFSRKLECLMKCSSKIFEALKESSGAPASADEFLPVLIYVILKSNPPLIKSNLNYISRFAAPSRIIRGESGYYFTNLCCAIQFIQDMNWESLRIPKEDFEAYTLGLKKAPNRNCSHVSATKSLENSLKKLSVLADNQQQLNQHADELVQSIDSSFKELDQALNEELESTSEPFHLPLPISICTRNGNVVEIVTETPEEIKIAESQEELMVPPPASPPTPKSEEEA